MLNFLIWFLLPILLFSFIGNQMNKKLMEKAGGGPGAMMFGGADGDGLPHLTSANSPLADYPGYLLDYENPYGAGRITIL